MTDSYKLNLGCVAVIEGKGMWGAAAVDEYVLACVVPSWSGKRFNMLVALCPDHCPDGAIYEDQGQRGPQLVRGG